MQQTETTGTIDSHCHLDFPQFDHDRNKVLAHCQQLGVNQLILPGTTTTQWPKAIALAAQYPALLPAIGLHPLFIDQHGTEATTQLIEMLTAHPEIIAIGEIGLDYTTPNRTQQLTLFEQQMNIAYTHQLPMLLHVRKAHQPTLETLRSGNHSRGIVHAFSGSYEQARQYIDQGFLLGVGGVVSWKNAHKLHRVVKQVPLDAIALETDAPDLPPAWASGERNSPEQIPRIAATIAQLRGEKVEEVARQTTTNVSTLFSLPNKRPLTP